MTTPPIIANTDFYQWQNWETVTTPDGSETYYVIPGYNGMYVFDPFRSDATGRITIYENPQPAYDAAEREREQREEAGSTDAQVAQIAGTLAGAGSTALIAEAVADWPNSTLKDITSLGSSPTPPVSTGPAPGTPAPSFSPTPSAPDVPSGQWGGGSGQGGGAAQIPTEGAPGAPVQDGGGMSLGQALSAAGAVYSIYSGMMNAMDTEQGAASAAAKGALAGMGAGTGLGVASGAGAAMAGGAGASSGAAAASAATGIGIPMALWFAGVAALSNTLAKAKSPRTVQSILSSPQLLQQVPELGEIAKQDPEAAAKAIQFAAENRLGTNLLTRGDQNENQAETMQRILDANGGTLAGMSGKERRLIGSSFTNTSFNNNPRLAGEIAKRLQGAGIDVPTRISTGGIGSPQQGQAFADVDGAIAGMSLAQRAQILPEYYGGEKREEFLEMVGAQTGSPTPVPVGEGAAFSEPFTEEGKEMGGFQDKFAEGLTGQKPQITRPLPIKPQQEQPLPEAETIRDRMQRYPGQVENPIRQVDPSQAAPQTLPQLLPAELQDKESLAELLAAMYEGRVPKGVGKQPSLYT